MLCRRHPVHVVLRVVGEVGSLRKRWAYHAIRAATLVAFRRDDFRIVHLSLQRTTGSPPPGYFPDWAERAHEPFLEPPPPTYASLLVRRATTWLLSEGWKRHGVVSYREVPSAR